MQNPNQFSQSVTKGQVDARFSPTVLPCVSGEDGLVPGMAVKIEDSAGGAPKVVAADADTDIILGFVCYNIKQATFNDGDALEVALEGTMLYLEASAAIARGARVMYVVTDEKVVTATAGKPIVGIAMDKAATNGDLIRVYVESFGFNNIDEANHYEASGTISSEELLALNATPKEILAAPAAGKAYVIDFFELALDYNSVAYDGIAGGEDLSLAYETAGEITRIESTGFLDQTSDQRRGVKPGAPADSAAAGAFGVAEAVELSLLTDEIATGDSPLLYKVHYRLVDAITL